MMLVPQMRSKVLSSNSRRSAFMTRNETSSSLCAFASSVACRIRSGEMSMPVTLAPRSANKNALLPSPHPYSSTSASAAADMMRSWYSAWLDSVTA